MKHQEATPLYKKEGRKYVPVQTYWHEHAGVDRMAVGTFRLTYAYQDGGAMYHYDVTPATAPTVAALMVAKVAMQDAIRAAVTVRHNGDIHYTKRQLALIAQFKQDMGMQYPTWWTSGSDYEIANAAIAAVQNFKP